MMQDPSKGNAITVLWVFLTTRICAAYDAISLYIYILHLFNVTAGQQYGKYFCLRYSGDVGSVGWHFIKTVQNQRKKK